MSSSSNAFFYGTLMHPQILAAVVGEDVYHRLEICHAVLPVKQIHLPSIARRLYLDISKLEQQHVSYPAIIPYWKSREVFNHDLAKAQQHVWGTLVTGLTEEDIEVLDDFEADEYSREVVDVRPIGTFTILAESCVFEELFSKMGTMPKDSELGPPVQAETYVFDEAVFVHLEADLWDFDEFIKNGAWREFSEVKVEAEF